MPKWLQDAIFYEIYPQSFQDTNGDGIGDFNGITEKLDYIKGLGCNALWINPCFDSPFKDAGYDVRDYKKTAARYGSNEDLCRLFDEAHKKGIRVLLDLVPGHTSEEHEWFRMSQKAEVNPYTNRFIWTSHCFEQAAGLPFIGGESERSATYVLNFFKCQPALNYGFQRIERDWQLPMDHPDCIATREAMKDVMRFWMDRGCDGFRVDMAASLVKNDDDKKSGTCSIWHEVRDMLDREYPEAAMVAEWGDPELALKAGFHMDFYLNCPGNGYSKLLRDYDNHRNAVPRGKGAPVLSGEDHSYFRINGGGDITPFLEEYLPRYQNTKEDGYFCLPTCNHDTLRPRYNMDERELALAYAFIFTMPGVPFLYYGDEIGMRYQELPTKEGGYFRTGSRTPMQWNHRANLGFSDGLPKELYLPVDSSPDAPTVEDQESDPDSLLNTVRALTALRHSRPELQAQPNFSVVYARKGKAPFLYRRGNLLLAVNPSGQDARIPMSDFMEGETFSGEGNVLFAVGNGGFRDGAVTLSPQSFLVIT